MAHCVVERLLGDPKQRVLRLQRQADTFVRFDLNTRSAGAQRFGVVGERRGEPVALEALGSQRVDEAAQLVEILRFWHSARNEPDLP